MLRKDDFKTMRTGRGRHPMTIAREDTQPAGAGWRKMGALVMCVAAIGLPVNNAADYALLLILAVVIFSGEVSAQGRAWLAALAIVAVGVAGQALLSPPRIDEGHNVFLPGDRSPASQRGLPAEVYRHLADAFDAQYPPARCGPEVTGCGQSGKLPDRAFAFSADGIFHKSTFSRAVAGIDFSDPVWLRLGFINDRRYNWPTAAPDAASRRPRPAVLDGPASMASRHALVRGDPPAGGVWRAANYAGAAS